MSVIQKGDPYQRQIEETVRGGCNGMVHRIASVTRAKWAQAAGCSLRCIKL